MSYRRHAQVKPSEIEWVDQIPVDWEAKRLRFVADISNSNVDKKAYDDQVSVRLCNYTDVYYNEVITPDLDFMEATASQAEIKKCGLRAGDVIITKDSEDPRDIGVPAFVQEDMPGVVCGYHLSIIRTSDPITAEYIQFSIMSHLNKARLYVDTPGVTRFGLDQDTIKNILVLLPPSDERRQIVRRLRSETAEIDGLIEKKTRFIALLKEKRAAVITHAVTKGIDPDAPMKDSGVDWLGRVLAHWDILRIAALFREVSRPADPVLPVLSVSIHDGVTDGELADEDRDRKVALSEDRTKYQGVAPGDLVYNMMRAWQGAFGAVTVKGLVSPAYVVAAPVTTFRTKFIEHLLHTKSAAEEIRRFSRGIADFRMRLYWDHFRTLKVCLPPLAEQDRILSEIDTETARIDGLISLTERSIDLLREKRAALITAAVTGKIDVRAAA
ncbi:restriction endonuclease subunit S (plasmid) [Nitratireductor rhodophyticola]|uniref:Restriction endonuclease subunit S n=1 Tax=Nitratireductor rhodophyticola TaxID=2854036 RepID=A0ABS7RDQ4_9HYPH|nr:restriction endonuclease subunit S [Nitratireductor rhodophyticola]MBY8919039.1 restriction endonuclease subunit S [Nitratireductor rhodophyticola]MBY8923108.1 restriction endonuclease subunit S [Nitratireductor rhodophyticola]MEC9249518.1 restriction endonuclease subunit S [Pseudomonadota bacterium]WPZ16277.1 restriction endonuclease subunit S [Nitratireductor rhodophyticola]